MHVNKEISLNNRLQEANVILPLALCLAFLPIINTNEAVSDINGNPRPPSPWVESCEPKRSVDREVKQESNTRRG